MGYEDEHRKDVVCAIILRHKGNRLYFLIGRRAGTLVLDGLFKFPVKYTLVGERIGGWCSILKVRSNILVIALIMKY